VSRFCRDVNKRALHLSPAAIEELSAYAWPGNVRELQNCIERAVILCDAEEIQPRHLNLSFPAALQAQAPADAWAAIDLSGTLIDAVRRVTREAEHRKIVAAMAEAGGSVPEAARALQIGHRVLLGKLRHYGIPEHQARTSRPDVH
jgi:DNA-binding NtrC family response regulator